MFKSMKKQVALLLAVMMMVVTGLTAMAANSPVAVDVLKPVTAKGVKTVYKSTVNTNKNGNAAIVSVYPYKGSTVEIKDTVKVGKVRYKATTINADAFKSKAKKVKTIKLGKNVTTVKANAFRKLTKLKKVEINSKKITISKKAFAGVDTKKVTITVSKNMSSKTFKALKKSLKKWFKGTIKRA